MHSPLQNSSTETSKQSLTASKTADASVETAQMLVVKGRELGQLESEKDALVHTSVAPLELDDEELDNELDDEDEELEELSHDNS